MNKPLLFTGIIGVIFWGLVGYFASAISTKNLIDSSDTRNSARHQADGGLSHSTSEISIITESTFNKTKFLEPMNEVWEKAKKDLLDGTCSPVDFGLLLSELGKLYGSGVLPLVLENNGILSSQSAAVERLIRNLAENDPKGTAEILKSKYNQDLLQCPSVFVKALAWGISKTNSSDITTLAASIATKKKAALQTGWISGIIQSVGYADAVGAINEIPEIAQLSTDFNASAVFDPMETVGYFAIDGGPDVARQYLDSIGASVDPQILSFLGARYGAKFPKDALDWVTALPSGELKQSALAGVLSGAAINEPGMALDYTEHFNGNRAELKSIINGLHTTFKDTNQNDWAEQAQEALNKLKSEK